MICIVSSSHFPDDERIYQRQIKSLVRSNRKVLYLTRSESTINLSNKLIKRLVDGTKKQSRGKSVEKISNIRDNYLLDLLLMRKKYEKKLR